MFLNWGALNRWHPFNHFVHHINIAKQLPKHVWYVKGFITTLQYSIIYFMLPFFLYNNKNSSLRESLCTLSIHILSLEFIGLDFMSVFLFVISLFFIGVILYTYAQSNTHLESGSMMIISFIFQIILPITLVINHSVLQRIVYHAIVDTLDIAELTLSIISLIIQYGLSILSYINNTKSIYGSEYLTTAWDGIYRIKFTALLLIDQQCWNLFYVVPKYGIYVVSVINIIILSYCIYDYSSLPLTIPKMNSVQLSFIMSGILTSLFNMLSYNYPSHSKLFLLAYFIILIYIFSYGASSLCKYYGDRLTQKYNYNPDFYLQDYSDDEIEFIDKGTNYILPVLRYLVTTNSFDINDSLMLLAGNSRRPNLQVECYRMLVLIGVTPPIVWKKILQVDPKDVNIFNKQLLCDLQYEAIRREHQNVDAGFLEELDHLKQDVRLSLIRIVSIIADGFEDDYVPYIDSYTEACEAYNSHVVMSIRNMSRSIPIMNHYADYLTKFRGDYVTGYYWTNQVELTRNSTTPFLAAHGSIPGSQISGGLIPRSTDGGGLFTSRESSLGSGLQQQVASQLVVQKIKSSWMGALMALCIVSAIWCFIPSFNPFSWPSIDPREHYGFDNAPYYFTTCLHGWYLRVLANTAGSDITTNTSMESEFGELEIDQVIFYNNKAMLGTSYHTLANIKVPVSYKDGNTNMSFNTSLQLMITMFKSEVMSSGGPSASQMECTEELYFRVNTALVNLMTAHSEFGLHKANQGYTKVISQFIGYCIVLVLLYGGVLVTALVMIPDDQKKFIQVFAEIDSVSLETFKSSLSSEIHNAASVCAKDSFNDEYTLDLDEIEFEENQSFNQTINLIQPDMDNFEDEDNDELNIEKPRLNSQSRFSIVFGVIIAMSILTNALVLHFSVTAAMGVFRSGNEISQLMLTASQVAFNAGVLINRKLNSTQIFEDTIDLGFIINNGFKYTFAESAEKRILEEGKKITQWALDPDTDVSVAAAALEFINNTEAIICEVLEEGERRINDKRVMSEVEVIISAAIGTITALGVITVEIAFVQNQTKRFDSLKAILLLLPSRYFSTISMLVSIMNRKGKGKVIEEVKVSSSILNHMKEPTIVFDSNLKICSANKQALAVFAIPRSFRSGTTIENVFPREKQPVLYQYIDSMLGPHGVIAKRAIQLVGRTSNNSELPLSATLYPLQTDEHGLIIMLVMQDKSEAKKLIAQIDSAKRQVLALLLRLVPPRIAQQLMTANAHTQQLIQKATLMMISIDSVPELCRTATHVQVVDIIESCMCRVERKLRKFGGVVRLRTFGSRFMFASGLFEKRSSREDVLEGAAFLVRSLKTIVKHALSFLKGLECSAVVHTGGPLLAGVIGESHSLYDVWGNVVDEICKVSVELTPGNSYITREAIIAAELVEPLTPPAIIDPHKGCKLWTLEEIGLKNNKLF